MLHNTDISGLIFSRSSFPPRVIQLHACGASELVDDDMTILGPKVAIWHHHVKPCFFSSVAAASYWCDNIACKLVILAVGIRYQWALCNNH